MVNTTMNKKHLDPKWQARFMELAETVSNWSKDPSTKVGAVLVTDDGKVAGLGYNGIFAGLDDTEINSVSRDYKNLMTVHAEQNALANMTIKDSRPLTLFVTKPCCVNCAKQIALHGSIKTIYVQDSPDSDPTFKERWNNDDALEIFKQMDIEYNII